MGPGGEGLRGRRPLPQTVSRDLSSAPCRRGSTKGFASWDDSFTRRFCPGVRPVTAPE